MSETPAGLLRAWVTAQAGDAAGWLDGQLALLARSGRARDLHVFLGLAPRRLGKADLRLDEAALAAADAARPGWSPADWSLDGAARVLALLTFRGDRPFAATLADHRRTPDAAELIALYRGLPLYPEPDALAFEAGEGLRSSLTPVFEAIAHRNPFPRDHFDEHRWNHMILKALFVGSALAPVLGLDARANPELARIAVDFAEERWAAGRPVPDELWRVVRPFAGLPAIHPALDRAVAAGRLSPETVA
jgi:hypothetical protein